MRQILFAGVFALGVAGCTHDIDLLVPASRAEDFSKCVADPSISWQPHQVSSATGPAAALSTMIDNNQAATRRAAAPLRTAPAKTFRNMYSDEAAAKARGQSSGGAAAPSSTSQTGDEVARAEAQRKASEAAVQRVQTILQHPVQSKINAIYNGLSGTTSAPETVDISVSDVKDYLNKVSESTSLDDWTLHANSAVYSFVEVASTTAAPADVAAASQDMALALFVESYMKAYFRNGKFVSGKASLEALETSVPALKQLSDADRKKIADLLKPLEKNLQFGKVADSGFVTRAGATFQFPPVNLSLDVAKAQLSVSDIDYLTVGTQLVRVLLEAIFDSHDRLPAVSEATGVTLFKDRNGVAAFRLPEFKKIQERAPYSKVSEDAFGKIDSYANQLDGAAAVVVGRVLRGAGPLALNNEALAKLIEVAIGASVHKVGEKVGWCWYAVKPQQSAAASALSEEVMQSTVSPALTSALIEPAARPVPTEGARKVKVRVSY